MRKFGRSGVALLSFLTLLGCAATDTPAVIVNQTTQGRRELAAVVAEALHGQGIGLSDDALQSVPTLLIDRMPARDARGLPLNGRELIKPVLFQLYRRQGHCLLVQQPAGHRWPLRNIQCIAIAKKM